MEINCNAEFELCNKDTLKKFSPYDFHEDFETCWIGEYLHRKCDDIVFEIRGIYDDKLIIVPFGLTSPTLYITAKKLLDQYLWESSGVNYDNECGNEVR